MFKEMVQKHWTNFLAHPFSKVNKNPPKLFAVKLFISVVDD